MTTKDLKRFCDERKLRLTEPRKLVLDIISKTNKPMTAYNILAQLGEYIKNPKPPTVYRAIEFLSEHGFIHRIESLNAYVICKTDHRHNGSQFMICRKCDAVIETHLCSLPDNFQEKLKQENFKSEHWNIEIHGLCGTCQ